MAEYRRSEIVSGLFILLALAVFTVFAFNVGGLQIPNPFRAKTIPCLTFFPAELAKLNQKSPVMIGGQRIGTVTSIVLAERSAVEDFWATAPEAQRPDWAKGDGLEKQAVQVEFEISEPEYVRLDPDSARISIGQEGLLGPKLLTLDPGRTSATKPIREVAESRRPIRIVPLTGGGFEALIQEGAGLIEQLKDILAKVDERILSDSNAEAIGRILGNMDQAMASAASLMDAARHYVDPSDDRSIDRKIINPANQLIERANAEIAEIGRIVREETLRRVNEILESGKVTVETAQRTMQKIEGEVSTVSGKVQGILDDLKGTTATLQARLDSLQSKAEMLLANANAAADGARLILVENRPEIAETMQAIRRIAWDAEILVKKIKANPAVMIWGDDEPLLGTAPVDESLLRRTGRARPFGPREEGGDGR